MCIRDSICACLIISSMFIFVWVCICTYTRDCNFSFPLLTSMCVLVLYSEPICMALPVSVSGSSFSGAMYVAKKKRLALYWHSLYVGLDLHCMHGLYWPFSNTTTPTFRLQTLWLRSPVVWTELKLFVAPQNCFCLSKTFPFIQKFFLLRLRVLESIFQRTEQYSSQVFWLVDDVPVIR